MNNALIKNGQSVVNNGSGTTRLPDINRPQPKGSAKTNRQIRTTTSILNRLGSTETMEDININFKENSEGGKAKGDMSSNISNVDDADSTKDSIIKQIQARDQLDIIREANKIMRERSKNSGSALTAKTKSKSDYLLDNKEICLKNYLIGLLKERRTDINDKELAITKALKESENRLEKDYKDFLSFVEKEKARMKNQEQNYLKIKNINEEIKKSEKMYIQDNKQILDELERTVKMIMNLKSSAVFVHSVVGVPFKFSSEGDSDNIKLFEHKDKDKNIETLTHRMIEDFSKIDLEDYPEFLYDTSHITNKFMELEENVLKLMEKKHNIDKELKVMDEKQKEEVEDLKKREYAVREEKIKLLIERDKDEKILNNLKSLNFEGGNKEYLGYIQELFSENSEHYHHSNSEKNKKKNDNMSVKELVDVLRTKENMIIDFITQMEAMEQEDETLFKSLVSKRKEKNKETKQKLKMEAQANQIALKLKKAEERSHRIIIKGRKVMERSNLNKGQRRVRRKENTKNEDDEYYMLFYDNENNI